MAMTSSFARIRWDPDLTEIRGKGIARMEEDANHAKGRDAHRQGADLPVLANGLGQAVASGKKDECLVSDLPCYVSISFSFAIGIRGVLSQRRNQENGDRSMPGNLMTYASQKDFRNESPPLTSHNDQSNILLPRAPEDLLNWGPIRNFDLHFCNPLFFQSGL
jgi:hypothetical protein